MKSEFEYGLKTSFVYAKSGSNVDAAFITLREPTQAHIGECGRVRQWLQRALDEMQESIKEEDADAVRDEQEAEREKAREAGEDLPMEKPDAKALIAVFASSTIPLHTLFETVTVMLKGKGIARVDGDSDMNPQIWKRITAEDLEGMIGEYVVNFLMR